MGYIVSYNSQHKTCKVHKDTCSSVRQVVGDKKSVYIYSDKKKYILKTCVDVKEYIEILQKYSSYSCCKICKPNCCDNT